MAARSTVWLWKSLLAAILLMIANVAVHVAYMVVYGFLLNPGHEPAFYEQHAQLSAPYSSIIAGFPLTFLVARLLGKWAGEPIAIKAALAMWAIYFGADLLVIILSGQFLSIAPIFAISFMTKFLAAYLGGRSTLRS